MRGLGGVGVVREGDLAVGVFGHVRGICWPRGLDVILLVLLLLMWLIRVICVNLGGCFG